MKSKFKFKCKENTCENNDKWCEHTPGSAFVFGFCVCFARSPSGNGYGGICAADSALGPNVCTESPATNQKRKQTFSEIRINTTHTCQLHCIDDTVRIRQAASTAKQRVSECVNRLWRHCCRNGTHSCNAIFARTSDFFFVFGCNAHTMLALAPLASPHLFRTICVCVCAIVSRRFGFGFSGTHGNGRRLSFYFDSAI